MRRDGQLDGNKDREEERRPEGKRDVQRAGGKYRYETRRTGRRGELPKGRENCIEERRKERKREEQRRVEKD